MDMRRAGLGLLLLLMLANVWKWWPTVGAHFHGQDAAGSRLFSVEDFQVHGLTMVPPASSGRDIFQIGSRDAGANESVSDLDGQTSSFASFGQTIVQPLSSRESGANIDHTPNGQIKCIGVLFQENKKPEAYVVRGDQHYILRPGDVLDGQFEVEKITINAVYFKNRQTGETSLVPVDGREGSVNE